MSDLLKGSIITFNRDLLQVFFHLFWLQILFPTSCVKKSTKFVCGVLHQYLFIKWLLSFLQMKYNGSQNLCQNSPAISVRNTKYLRYLRYIFTIYFFSMLSFLISNFSVPTNYLKIPNLLCGVQNNFMFTIKF